MRRSHAKKEDRVKQGSKRERRDSLPPVNGKHKPKSETIVSADMAAPPPALVVVDKKKINQKFLDAAYSDDFETVKDLVDAVDVNARDEIGYSALMRFVECGNLEAVEFLIEKKADVNAADKDGITALMLAASYDQLEIVKLLVENKAKVNVAEDYGRSALDYAVKNGNYDIVEFLIDEAKLDSADVKGVTALMLAARHNRIEIAELLIRKGAYVNDIDENDKGAIDHAKEKGNEEMAKFLKKNGAME